MRSLVYYTAPLMAEIALPLSKSISNRVLIIDFLRGVHTDAECISTADDTRIMHHLLQKVRAKVGGNEPVVLDVNNAGTVMRFLLALLAVTPGKWQLTGTDRMLQRPVGALVNALQHLGATITYSDREGFPPLFIEGGKLQQHSWVTINAGISSQFISALMMIAPAMGGLVIEWEGEIVSRPYIEMSRKIMQKAGAEVSMAENKIIVSAKPYVVVNEKTYSEPDWSSAAFWYQIVAFSNKGKVLLKNLPLSSVQGDSVLPEIFKKLGVQTVQDKKGLLISKFPLQNIPDFHYDFINCPDLVQAVAVVCAVLCKKATLTGLSTLKNKETDRIEALKNELEKLGCKIAVGNDCMEICGVSIENNLKDKNLHFYTYDDHRMAMCLAPLAMLAGEISFDKPKVVSKSYPHFWDDLSKAGIVFID